MSETVLEIRYAQGWLKFYCVVISFIILILIILAILDFDFLNREALLFITIPFFVGLISIGLKVNNRKAQLTFSEIGIAIPLGLKRIENSDRGMLTKGEKNLFVPWNIIQDAEFVYGKGGTAIALDTEEDEIWRATRPVIPAFSEWSFRKYIFDVEDLELEPSRIVSMIKRLAETPPAERKDVLLHFSKNLI
jgi:hypothetical protein